MADMTENRSGSSFETLRWSDDGVVLLDQRRLPSDEIYLTLGDVEGVARAIEDLVVRGAPAIGCTAAMGVALAARRSEADDPGALADDLESAIARLAATRPTAVNLFWALDRMRRCFEKARTLPEAGVAELRAALLDEALEITDEDAESCRRIGEAGLSLVPHGARILTHCNAGALATAGIGTALGVVRAAHGAGREISVLAGETRPYLQGARLTAWELARDGIPVAVHTDGMAGHLMQRGAVDLVVVGADRIAANGDVANKIGTFALAVLAREHAIPFYVAAPLSTVDFAMESGDGIEIEERGRDEIAHLAGACILPEGVPVHHPAFDVTPSRLVTAIVTDRGVVTAPYRASLRELAVR